MDTPSSSSSRKRGSSTSTTASSPSKKSKSPAVSALQDFVFGSTQHLTDKSQAYRETMDIRKQAVQDKLALKQQALQQALELRERMAKMKLEAKVAKIKKVQDIARQDGVDESSPMWQILMVLCESDQHMDFFIGSQTKEGRMNVIQLIAAKMEAAGSSMHVDQIEDHSSDGSSDDLLDDILSLLSSDGSSDESWDEEMQMFLEDDLEDIVPGMYMFAKHHDKYLNRKPYRDPDESGLVWVLKRLADDDDCYDQFRMYPPVFHRLHDLLVHSYGLKSSSKSSSIEALGMFLWVLGHGSAVRESKDKVERSTGTVHNNFKKVLDCVVSLSEDILKPLDPNFTSIHPKLRKRRYKPFFDNCIGAIDGTHIPVTVHGDLLVQHMSRKGKPTQNVMAICDFNQWFTFVLAGWPGSVHDMRVFNDATSRWSHKYPHPPQGKFYLVDSGYPNRPGYLAPYKSYKYHVPDFIAGPPPEGKHEIFNHAHSSLRNVIERAFGMLKNKWRILFGIPSYPPDRQTEIIYACFALHNFVLCNGILPPEFDSPNTDNEEEPVDSETEDAPPQPAQDFSLSNMNDFREWIANGLVNRQ